MDKTGQGLQKIGERVRLLDEVQRAKQLRAGIQHLQELQSRTSEAVEQARVLCTDADVKLREACETLDRLAGELGPYDPPAGS